MTKQLKPTAAHRSLEVFIGDWHAEGTFYGDGQDTANPRAAGEPWTSDESYEWLPSGFFVLHRWDAMAGSFKSTEIMGYDEAEGGYFTEAQTCASGTVQADGDKMTFNWEWKNGGRKWLPLCDRVASRTQPTGDTSRSRR